MCIFYSFQRWIGGGFFGDLVPKGPVQQAQSDLSIATIGTELRHFASTPVAHLRPPPPHCPLPRTPMPKPLSDSGSYEEPNDLNNNSPQVVVHQS